MHLVLYGRFLGPLDRDVGFVGQLKRKNQVCFHLFGLFLLTLLIVLMCFDCLITIASK